MYMNVYVCEICSILVHYMDQRMQVGLGDKTLHNDDYLCPWGFMGLRVSIFFLFYVYCKVGQIF